MQVWMYGEQQLGLDVLVNVVQAGHVGRAVAHHKVRHAAAEVRDDLTRCRLLDLVTRVESYGRGPW